MVQKNLQTHKFEVKDFKEVYDFCYLNNIMDINSFIDKCFKQGFHIEKYGLLGETLNEGENHLKTDGIQEKWVEKEVIVEKRVEIPVEVIKYVDREVIKEVPTPPTEVEVIKYVDREVIKEIKTEVPVEKIVYIYDKNTENELGGKIAELMNEMTKKDEELDELRRSLDIKLDEHKVKMLTETLTKLKKELGEKNKNIEDLENKIKELESIKINQGAVFMKGSNLTQNL